MSDWGLGSYVYCVTRADAQPSLEGVAAVDAARPIEVLREGDLAAVLSQVSLENFGREALERNLEDLAWVEQTALAHNAVLARVQASDAVVPFRICTIFEDNARVAEMLVRQHDYFRNALERLQRRDEWSVKILADRQRLEGVARERLPSGPGASSTSEKQQTPGRAFFARKQLDRNVGEKASDLARKTAQHAHAQLQQRAAAAKLLPPQDPRVSQRSGAMILNGAYLVDRSAAPEFSATIEQLRQHEFPDGVELVLSGPFAPYNFVNAPDEQ